jgi:hypothetical protein
MAYTTIDDPTSFFNTILYTGDGNTSRGITGVGFQPDWLWIKRRDATEGHVLFDVVRSADARLQSNNNSVEADRPNIVYSFDSDGFSISQSGVDNASNNNGGTYVAWNWLAGGSASSNSNGDITSSVSANTTSGFSIVSYTGTGSVATIGHGLGVAPKLIIVKTRSYSNQAWPVDVRAVDGILYLNETGTKGSYGNSSPFPTTAPTASVFSVGSPENTNASSATYIAYCFAEKQGYSKIGSYTGNGNANGTFVYTGFKPAWVMLKRSSDGTNSWEIRDNKRQPFPDGNAKRLFADSNVAESSNTEAVEKLSNGFKIRSTGAGHNTSGSTYIYMAFAESPFVNSNGIPNNAR